MGEISKINTLMKVKGTQAAYRTNPTSKKKHDTWWQQIRMCLLHNPNARLLHNSRHIDKIMHVSPTMHGPYQYVMGCVRVVQKSFSQQT